MTQTRAMKKAAAASPAPKRCQKNDSDDEEDFLEDSDDDCSVTLPYSTEFSGEFTCTPPLSRAQVVYLRRFASLRRVRHTDYRVAGHPDPFREAVGLPIGEDCEYYVGGPQFPIWDPYPSITDFPRSQPSDRCQWMPTADGTCVEWSGGREFYGYYAWLTYMIERFFIPWGVTLNGKVEWQGDAEDDHGYIHVAKNKASLQPRLPSGLALIPSWGLPEDLRRCARRAYH